MKKLIAIALLAVASSFASATDLTLAYLNKPNAPAANVSTSAPEAAANAPAPTGLVKGASKVGAFIGGLMKGPAMMGKAFVSGIGAGYSGEAAPKRASAVASNTQEAVSSKESAPSAGGQHPLAVKLAALLKRPQNQAAAPVEERSTLASNAN